MKYAKKFSSSEDYMTWRTSNNYQIPSVTYISDSEEPRVVYHKFPDTYGYDYVDLALPSGTLWGTMNVGAQSSSDPGDYFTYGDIYTSQSYTEDDYYLFNGEGQEYNKYNSTDGKTELELMDDAANESCHGEWHIPTADQWDELLINTERTVGNGGVTFTGANGNSIFLPATGVMVGNSLENSSVAFYLSSSLHQFFNRGGGGSSDYCKLYIDDLSNSKPSMDIGPRYNGYVVRPVIGRLKGLVMGPVEDAPIK